MAAVRRFMVHVPAAVQTLPIPLSFPALRSALLALALAGTASGIPVEEIGVSGVSGGNASNQTYAAFVTCGQPSTVGWNGSAGVAHRAGFAGSFLLFPGVDHDGDGVPDEDDPDDDGDRIPDPDELSGGRFTPLSVTDPLDADTDDDGALDGDELGAGSNPLDPGSALRILEVRRVDGGIAIEWLARGGLLYRVKASEALEAGGAVTTAVRRASGGFPPWFGVRESATNPAAGPAGFYRIEVKP